MLMRRYKGYAPDDRIVLVDFIDEIPRLDPENNIHGVICPHNPFKDNEREELIDFMRLRIINKTGGAINAMAFNDPILAVKFPKSLARLFMDLDYAFERATGQRSETQFIRTNTPYPIIPHKHGKAATYAVSRDGSVLYNGWRSSVIPPMCISIFNENIRHRASLRFSLAKPRVIAIAG